LARGFTSPPGVKQSFERSRSTQNLSPGTSLSAPVDLATETGRAALLVDLQNRWSALDGLVNNLGTNIRKPSLDYSLTDLQELMAINVEPAWELSRACFPWLEASRGSIVNLSSVAAERAVRSSTAAYAMSKGAIEGMTRFFACEWAPLGLRVNAVRPWYTKTPLAEQVLKDPVKRAADPGANASRPNPGSRRSRQPRGPSSS
jgi:Tropinone reductase 1